MTATARNTTIALFVLAAGLLALGCNVIDAAPDGPDAAVVGRQREAAARQVADAHLDVASHYMVRQSYPRALDEVERSLALSPNHDAALEMRARIETAAGLSGRVRVTGRRSCTLARTASSIGIHPTYSGL